MAVDASNPPSADYSGNVYIAWASIDVEPANPNPYTAPGFNPNRAELVVGTTSATSFTGTLASGSASVIGISGNVAALFVGEPITGTGIPSGTTIKSVQSSTSITLSTNATASGSQSLTASPLAFSGVTTVNVSGNDGSDGPQLDSDPQLVINQSGVAASFTGTLASGSASVTDITGNTGSLAGGEPVTGTGIPAGTTIQTVEDTNFSGTLTSGSYLVTDVSSTTGLFVGETVAGGASIPGGTTIQQIDSADDTITLSSSATISDTQTLFGISAVVLSSSNVTFSGSESLTVTANSPGNVTVAWDDFGTGASASPAYDNLMSNLVQPGDAYGFTGSTGVIQSGVNSSSGMREIGLRQRSIPRGVPTQPPLRIPRVLLSSQP